jgi:hypothetical protein
MIRHTVQNGVGCLASGVRAHVHFHIDGTGSWHVAAVWVDWWCIAGMASTALGDTVPSVFLSKVVPPVAFAQPGSVYVQGKVGHPWLAPCGHGQACWGVSAAAGEEHRCADAD